MSQIRPDPISERRGDPSPYPTRQNNGYQIERQLGGKSELQRALIWDF